MVLASEILTTVSFSEFEVHPAMGPIHRMRKRAGRPMPLYNHICFTKSTACTFFVILPCFSEKYRLALFVKHTILVDFSPKIGYWAAVFPPAS
jgi:hypothetical protein